MRKGAVVEEGGGADQTQGRDATPINPAGIAANHHHLQHRHHGFGLLEAEAEDLKGRARGVRKVAGGPTQNRSIAHELLRAVIATGTAIMDLLGEWWKWQPCS